MSDFRFLGRYSISDIVFTVIDSTNTATNADAPPVVEFRDYATNTLIFTRMTTQIDIGRYSVTLSSTETANPGLYYLHWVYTLASIPQEYRTDIEVPQSASTIYDTLSDGYRASVDGVWAMFEDLFDSDIGGPHLKMYAQTRFGRETIARMMGSALAYLNGAAQPHQSFTLDPAGQQFPFNEWGGILDLMTYIRVIEHLMRSYVEQPQAQGVTPARLDRRDYLDRWGQILQEAKAEMEQLLPVYKIAFMNMGRSALLVAGGLYGNIPSWHPAQRPSGLPPYVR